MAKMARFAAAVALGVLALLAVANEAVEAQDSVDEVGLSTTLCTAATGNLESSFVRICAGGETGTEIGGNCVPPMTIADACTYDAAGIYEPSEAGEPTPEIVVAGAPAGVFDFYTVDMYWVPSFCSNVTSDGDSQDAVMQDKSLLCTSLPSTFGSPGYTLALASFTPRYDSPVGAIPGFCVGQGFNYSLCATDAALTEQDCEDLVTSSAEKCGPSCLMPDQWISSSPLDQRSAGRPSSAALLAPSWFAPPQGDLLISQRDVVWSKHASCAGGDLSESAQDYVATALKYGDLVSAGPGLVITNNTGGNVTLSQLEAAFPNNTAVFDCNDNCELEGLSLCVEVKEDLMPGFASSCPESYRKEHTSCDSCANITIEGPQGFLDLEDLQDSITNAARDLRTQIEEVTRNISQEVQTGWSQFQEAARGVPQRLADAGRDILNSFTGLLGINGGNPVVPPPSGENSTFDVAPTDLPPAPPQQIPEEDLLAQFPSGGGGTAAP